MKLAKTIEEVVRQSKKITPQNNFVTRIIPFLDLTSLNDTDDSSTISKLCKRAITPYGKVASVCVYPQFTQQVHQALLDTSIKTTTVANFSEGSADLISTLKQIQQAEKDGAEEIDIVMPYRVFLEGNTKLVFEFIKSCKEACGNICLKIILETGAIQKFDLIYKASVLAIEAGADFIKTSTGKTSVGATLDAAVCMLQAIKDTNKSVGFKASGGIRTRQKAAEFLHLTELMMTKSWLTQNTFRLGVSTLLDNLLTTYKTN